MRVDICNYIGWKHVTDIHSFARPVIYDAPVRITCLGYRTPQRSMRRLPLIYCESSAEEATRVDSSNLFRSETTGIVRLPGHDENPAWKKGIVFLGRIKRSGTSRKKKASLLPWATDNREPAAIDNDVSGPTSSSLSKMVVNYPKLNNNAQSSSVTKAHDRISTQRFTPRPTQAPTPQASLLLNTINVEMSTFQGIERICEPSC